MPNLDSMRLSVRHCRHRTDNPGTRWGPRIIPDYELLLIREGEYVYSESDRTFPLRKGDLLLIEPAIEHVFLAKGPGYGVHCSAHFDLLDPEGSICFLGRLDSRSRRQPVSAPEHIAHVFELAAKSFAGKGRFRTETVNSAIRANEGYTVTGTNVTGETLDFVSNEIDTVRNQKFIRLVLRKK